MTTVLMKNLSPIFTSCVVDVQPFNPGGKADIQDINHKGLLDRQNLKFPAPLMSNKMHRDDLIRFIHSRSQECLLRVDEPELRESHVLWNIIELLRKKDGKVMMPEVGVILFRCYSSFKKMASKLRVAYKKDDWCLLLATLLCAAMPEDKHRKAVIELGDTFASKGLPFAAHICYVVANKELDLCETIARAVTTFRDRITDASLDQLICLFDKVLEDKEEEEPEWLLNLRQLHKEAAAISDACTVKEQHNETPPTAEVSSTLEDYRGRAGEYRAFSLLTEEVISKYTIGALLGHGGFGAVFAGVRKADGREVAMKFFMKDEFAGMMTVPGETNRIPVEVGLMEMVSKPFGSPFVLELLEWFEIPDFIVLILERPIPCMDLLDFCELHGNKLPEPLARDIMFQLVQAARHCCDRGVFHNDIKPSNILINTSTLQIKLIDFGSGDLLQDTPYTYCPGTLMYFPPEWCLHKKYMARPTTIWTLGIVLFELVYGNLPFGSWEEIINNQLHFGPGVSKDCCDLISWCLKKDPKERPTFRQIFRHRWFMAGQRYIESVPVVGRLMQSLLDFYVGFENRVNIWNKKSH